MMFKEKKRHSISKNLPIAWGLVFPKQKQAESFRKGILKNEPKSLP